MNQFELAAGSIVGRAHVGTGGLLKGKNNQDTYLIHEEETFVVALVLDGCGSGKHSEVGSQVGAKLIMSSLLQKMQRQGLPSNDSTMEILLRSVEQEVIAQLYVLARTLAGNGSFSEIVNDYLSFTVLGTFISDQYYAVFGLGDGVFAINGTVLEIGPFPKNAPPLLAYRLLDLTNSAYTFTLHDSGAPETLESILIGSDGAMEVEQKSTRMLPGQNEEVGPLRQFVDNDFFFKNPDAMRRRLTLVNSERFTKRAEVTALEPGLLTDDTTIVAIRRRKEVTVPNANEASS